MHRRRNSPRAVPEPSAHLIYRNTLWRMCVCILQLLLPFDLEKLFSNQVCIQTASLGDKSPRDDFASGVIPEACCAHSYLVSSLWCYPRSVLKFKANKWFSLKPACETQSLFRQMFWKIDLQLSTRMILIPDCVRRTWSVCYNTDHWAQLYQDPGCGSLVQGWSLRMYLPQMFLSDPIIGIGLWIMRWDSSPQSSPRGLQTDDP